MKEPTMISLLTNVTNIIICAIVIFGFQEIDINSKIIGVGSATLISRFISFICSYLFFRLSIKEKISFTPEGLWQTNLIVYNLETGRSKVLSEVRGAIEYYWRQHNLNLKNYRWDIYPIGWDSINPDRIIVFAYAATGAKPKYLGAWSIDYKGDRAMLLSLTSADFLVTQNGYCLKTKLKN